jgi:serine/threonine protein kinase
MIEKKKLSTPRLFNNLKNEISILSKINSPYVIRLVDLQRTENNFYLVTELCNGGDLNNLRRVRKRFQEAEARVILQQLVQGFKEIYSHQVMHRDLKLANILVHFPNEDFSDIEDIRDPIDRELMLTEKLKKIQLVQGSI